MRNTAKNAKAALSLAAVIAGTSLMSSAFAADVPEGYKLITDRKKGNCVACHAIQAPDFKNNQAGNAGPPLHILDANGEKSVMPGYMKMRFPNRADLYNQIYDATKKNENSLMPPFGSFNILSEAEINSIMDYLYSI